MKREVENLPSDIHHTGAPQRIEARTAPARILAVDIGGTLIKASVIDAAGEMLAPWTRTSTPERASPDDVIATIEALAEQLPSSNKMAIAFPGVVSKGIVATAPNLAAGVWRNYDLRSAIQSKFGCDVRILNDAIVQGLGVAHGPGLECVLTLGTGLGFALFRDGRFLVQLELGQNGMCGGQNFDSYVGHAAFVSEGETEWNRRVEETFAVIRRLVTPDRILVGGGNARRIAFDLPDDVALFPMTAGVTGGATLWADPPDPFIEAFA